MWLIFEFFFLFRSKAMVLTWLSASGALTMKPTTFCCRMSCRLCAGWGGLRLR